MSREIRRVPIDFDWPLNRIWEGYLAPEKFNEDPCPDCYRQDYLGKKHHGSGSTAAHSWLRGALYLIGMMADDLRAQGFEGTERQFTGYGDDRSRLHPYLATLQNINVYEHRRPSEDIVALVRGITGRSDLSFGTGSEFAYKAGAALVAAAGLPEDWGTCPTCKGDGSIEKCPGQRAEGEAWAEEDHSPPTGDGWQVWETTSEGSPISPVFPDREGLIGFLMSDQYHGFGTSPTPLTREQAEAFVDAGSSLGTFVQVGGQIMGGDAAVHELASKDTDG